jgi:hypothetical protein
MKSKSKGKSSRAVGIGAYDEAKWRAEHDMNTLLEAKKIENDPKRFAAAKACAREKLEAVASVAGASAKS